MAPLSKLTPCNRCRYLPTRVIGLEGVKVVSAECGWRHSAVVSKDGVVFTFGWSKYGQLGHGDHM